MLLNTKYGTSQHTYKVKLLRRALLHGRLSILWTEFGCLPSGDDCVISKIVLIVDAKDMDSVLGSPYHEIRIALDALLSVTPRSSL